MSEDATTTTIPCADTEEELTATAFPRLARHPHPIVRRRIELGMTQYALARACGTSQTHLSRIESGSQPKVALAIVIARALKTRVEDLWG